MDLISIVHTVFSVLALVAGAVVFFNTKGTRRHVNWGRIYVVSMLLLLFTSFFIFDLFGGFGPFHIMAILSLVTLSIGMYFPLFARRRRSWLIHHYMWMSYSYVGLVMAAGSHFFDLVPDWPGWLRMALFWGLPYAVGSLWIFRRRKQILAEVRERMELDIAVA